jgi:hypothetical protein
MHGSLLVTPLSLHNGLRCAPQVGVMAAVGPVFGITRMQSIRAGMLLAAGGEFAFVAFGESSGLRDGVSLLYTSTKAPCMTVVHVRLAAHPTAWSNRLQDGCTHSWPRPATCSTVCRLNGPQRNGCMPSPRT